jgi:PIN domain nuclease of toxin-antitoxin system
MRKTVLDATALLALFNDEPGAGTIASFLPQAVISTSSGQ